MYGASAEVSTLHPITSLWKMRFTSKCFPSNVLCKRVKCFHGVKMNANSNSIAAGVTYNLIGVRPWHVVWLAKQRTR